MNPLRAIFGMLAIAVLNGITPAQHGFDIQPLPSGFPGSPVSRVFTGDDALAITDGTSIFVLTGMRDPATFSSQVITPSGALAMATHWCSLGSNTAAYSSTAGELVLVRDLPASPTLVATGIFDPNPCWRIVNPTTAVRFDKTTGQLTVLRHGPSGATLHVIQSPVPLSQWGTFGSRPSGDDRFLAMGGNINRELVIFSGLSGAPSAFTVSTFWVAPPGTTGNPLHGFTVTATGTGVGWEHTSLTSTELSLVRFGSGAPVAVKFTATASLIIPGGGLSPYPAQGDNIILRWQEDLDEVQVLLIGVDDTPQTVYSWHTGWYGPWEVIAIAEDELLVVDWNQGPHHHVFSGPNAGSQLLPATIGSNLLSAAKPNPDTLVILSQGSGGVDLDIFTELQSGAIAFPVPLAGPSLLASLIIVDRGRVGVLANYPGAPPWLAFFSLPTACDVGGTDPTSSGLHLVPWPTAPRIGSHFELRTWAHAGGTAPGIAVATSLGPSLTLGSPFASGSLIDLGLGSLLGILPTQLVTGSSASPGLFGVDLGLENAPLPLAGFPLYVQAVQLDGSTWYVSNTLLVIPG